MGGGRGRLAIVRLELTRRTDHATRALIELDRLGRRAKAAELAEAVGTSAGFLTQTLAALVARRWVRSEPGPTGGYALAVALDSISLLEVIEAVEGPTVTGRCVLEQRACSDEGPCALHEPWLRARSELLESLRRTSLSDLR